LNVTVRVRTDSNAVRNYPTGTVFGAWCLRNTMSHDSETLAESRLREYVGEDDEASKFSIAVVNESRPEALEGMVRKLFARQPVEITEADEDRFDDDSAVLLRDGEVVASSSLDVLSKTLLLVNSDLYTTGTVSLEETRFPDVIAELSGTTFDVRGYPESDYEKMPLILISRHIELLSYRNGGTHRASFQRLSRIQDERGTRNVYRRLGSSGADTHVYGVPDWTPPREFGVKIHGGYETDHTSAWFVVHVSDEEKAALVALETASNRWKGRWTFDADEVADIEESIKEYY